jgi:hypothetical protein
MSSIVKDKYEYIKKLERDRIIGQGFIPSYGKMPVINKKYDQVVDKINQKITSLKEMNKDLTDLQKSYIDILESKIDLARLKILYENLPPEDEEQSVSSSILSMLSFRDFCGLGTNIYKNINEDLDNPIGMFKVDSACLKHDIAYSKAKTKEDQHKADIEMLYELGQKYIFNYENNFLTGDYKTDFTNWSSSFKTVSNYLLSFAETVFTGYIIKSNIMSIFNFHKYYLMGMSPLTMSNLFYDQGLELPQPSNLRDYRTRGALDEDIRQIGALGRAGLPNAFKELGINLFFSTILRDKFLAIGTFLLMSGKLALEKFGIKDVTPIAEHKISEEDIVALESLYKELENEFEIKPTEPEPSVGKEPINIETLKSDITDIIDTNIRYNETKTEMIDAIVDDMDELISQPEPELIPTEQSDNLKKLQDLYDLTVKLFKKIDYDYETVEPPTQLVPNLQEDIKKTKDTTLIQPEISSVPNIPEDIKTSEKTSTLIQEEIEPQEKEEIKINYKNEL